MYEWKVWKLRLFLSACSKLIRSKRMIWKTERSNRRNLFLSTRRQWQKTTSKADRFNNKAIQRHSHGFGKCTWLLDLVLNERKYMTRQGTAYEGPGCQKDANKSSRISCWSPRCCAIQLCKRDDVAKTEPCFCVLQQENWRRRGLYNLSVSQCVSFKFSNWQI